MSVLYLLRQSFHTLENEEEIILDESIMEQAKLPLEQMLALAK